ncbi:hypothetical protein [Streptomyces sp. AC512_CC834]|uniref:hypothetical protein n=1 Tax=Streptomyces sp. AC512_CC834 TaxID=2823691 RepID=UPI001C2636D5|nr:hypothetical protein [Streptomyces sp. AC512_CC834]
MTAGGVTSGIDLALRLTTRECGASAAGVESIREYEQRGVVWRAPDRRRAASKAVPEADTGA